MEICKCRRFDVTSAAILRSTQTLFFSSLTLSFPGSCLCVSECVCFSAGSGMASLSGPLRKAAPGAGYRREGRATRRQAQPSGVRAQLHHNASAPHVNRCFLPSAPTHTASHTHTQIHMPLSLYRLNRGPVEGQSQPQLLLLWRPTALRPDGVLAAGNYRLAGCHCPTPNSLLHFQNKKRQQQSFIANIWIWFYFI